MERKSLEKKTSTAQIKRRRGGGGEEAFVQGDRARRSDIGFGKEKGSVTAGSKWSAKWIGKRVNFQKRSKWTGK